MPTLQTLPQDELDRQSERVHEMLVTAWRAIAAETDNTIVAASSPIAWAKQIGQTLSALVDLYLRAVSHAFNAVNVNADPLAYDAVFRWADDEHDRLLESLSKLDTDGDEPPKHLRTIAQTEVHGAANAGMHAQLKALVDAGLTTITCTWYSMHDDKVRAWHHAANGQQIKINEAFRVGDSYLLAPGIPMPGQPFDVGDLCNCRCTVKYTYDIISSRVNNNNGQEALVSNVDGTALVASAKWKPEAHPRGKDGRFIKKGSVQTLLATKKPMINHVLDAVKDLDGKQWDKLTPKQQEYIKDTVEKLPHVSTSYKNAKEKLNTFEPTGAPSAPSAPSAPVAKAIAAHKGAAPGTPAKVSTALVWGKYSDGDVILESPNGSKRVIWDGNAKKYATQEKLPDGTWKSTKVESKKDFYASNKGSNDYVVPGASPDVVETPVVETEAPTPSVPTPSVPTPSVPIPSVPIPNVKPAFDASGGKPLSYTDEDVISNWLGHLNKEQTIGDVVALSSDGKYRVTYSGKQNSMQVYNLQEWNKYSGEWEDNYKYVGKTWLKKYTHTFTEASWLAPTSDGKPYPVKQPVTPVAPVTPITPITPVSSEPIHVSPSVQSADATMSPLGKGGDILGISSSVKTDFKAVLKTNKIGYWSKPEKIWDSVQSIQKKYPDSTDPTKSQYTALQVLKTLDSTLKTSAPSPFMDKITKWATTPKGQAYISKSFTPSTPSTPVSAPAVVPTPPSSAVSNIPVHASSDDISHLTPEQKKDIFTTFKSHSGTYLTSPKLSIFTAAKSVAQGNNLSVMQALKAIDEVGADNAGTPNKHLFEKAVTEWLSTPQGTVIASGEAMSKALARKVNYTPGISSAGIMSFDESSKFTYKNMTVANANKFGTDIQKQYALPETQISAMHKYTGGVYQQINSYLYGATDTLSATDMTTAKNVQKSMRPSTEPVLLHRGVEFGGIANSTDFADLKSKVGQTWLSGGFFSTSVGGKAAFNSKPVLLQVEAPPGTPMSWLEPHSSYPGEHEMLLAAGLQYRILSVDTNAAGKAVVRLRVVPPTEKVTV